MKLTPSTMADVVIAWFERFELNQIRHEEQAFLAARPALEVIQRADQERRRAEWKAALRDCQLALTGASDQQRHGNGHEANEEAEKQAAYTEATVRLYFGTILLAHSAVLKDGATQYLDAALRQCQKSVGRFRELKRWRAESIAQAAIAMVYAVRRKWSDAIEAYQQSVTAIDKMAPLNSSLEELRDQIGRTIPAILDRYEQETRSDTGQ